MVSQLPSPSFQDVVYPDSDGKPMADNTKQFRWIVVIQQNLEWLFANDPTVFVAGDLLWYPIEGNNQICTAPDVMVIVGRPKGDRGSYKQWAEGNIAPQVVFEILSPSNTLTEMHKKQEFYDRHGVEEYYLFDPDKQDFSGWVRAENRLSVIDPIDDWSSPRLGIRFDRSAATLQIYRPDGQPFLSYTEIAQQLNDAAQQLNQERQEKEQAVQRLRQAESEAAQAQQRAAQLAERLRAIGIDPDQT